jgi:phospholipid/cholesterol/gamma-HCH transport system substrate-binding protein
MKGLGSAIKVGLVVLIVVIGGYATFKSVSEQASGSEGYTLWGKFRDASGLVDKSRVVIAGLTIGEIADRRLDGKFARVTVRVRRDAQVWSNAAIFKKSSSLLGEFYLEIDPGTPQSVSDRGTIVENRLLGEGDEIKIVVEATSIADLVTQVSRVVPHVDEVLLEVRDLAADARQVVNGPVKNIAANLDRAVAEDTVLVKSILEKTDRIAENVDEVLAQARPDVSKILDNIEHASADVRELIAVTKGEIQMTGEDVRSRLARLDQTLADFESTMGSAASIGRKIDGAADEPQGTLGKLVNDPTIADNAAQITEDVRGFTSGLMGLQTIVGLRAEITAIEQLSRAYFQVEIYPRPDKFYLFELVSEPRGDISTTYTVNEDQTLRRSTAIDWQGIKFTLQYGRKFGWLSLRGGIKDSTGGVGADIDPWNGRARLSLDLFEFTFNRLPRLRAMLAYRFFSFLYVTAGVDDILNPHREIPVTGDNFTDYLPKSYHFGIDPFVGAMIRFTDEDLKSLLFVGGSALSGLAK